MTLGELLDRQALHPLVGAHRDLDAHLEAIVPERDASTGALLWLKPGGERRP